ncbi:MAG: hypothetical protein MUP17_09535 [candidate division Zixibacteria bacterium]|nr:hypothetical protein [candidate division Zixibacteria bacterium]
MSDDINLKDLAPADLMEMFPEAKLTMRDRLPTNILLLYTFLNINKTIKDIKFSADELREAMLALVAMIPDELRDPEFLKDLTTCTQSVFIDVRPQFCGVKASVEYCRRKKIPTHQEIRQINYFDMYHAVFNLLMRKHMLLKIQPKEIMTGLPYHSQDPGPAEEGSPSGEAPADEL